MLYTSGCSGGFGGRTHAAEGCSCAARRTAPRIGRGSGVASGAGIMFFPEGRVRVHLCGQPVDMRKSYDGLYALTRSGLQLYGVENPKLAPGYNEPGAVQ